MLESNEDTHATALSANFYIHFQAKKTEITSRLDALNTSNISETNTTDISKISSDIVKLRKDLVDATFYLPSYDRGRCEQQIGVLEATLSKYRAPKTKFAFKRKPTVPALQPSPPPDSEVTNSGVKPLSTQPLTVHSTTNLSLSSRSSAQLTLFSLVRPPTEVFPSQSSNLPHSSDITLTDLQDCIINLFPSTPPDGESMVSTLTITALHARNLSRVVLAMPPIEGSVLLHDVHNSIIIIGCHQFRMHNSTNTIVLLHVLSNPIIEHSKDILFGAYPMALCHSFPQSVLERSSNHAMVQDFDWIKSSQSPNWGLFDSSPSFEERVVQVVDNEVDDNGLESVLKDILSQVLPSTIVGA